MINLEQEYEKYLDRVGMDRKRMPIVQYVEMKRAFMGACGQILIHLRDEVALMKPEDGPKALADMVRQVGQYWANEAGLDYERYNNAGLE